MGRAIYLSQEEIQFWKKWQYMLTDTNKHVMFCGNSCIATDFSSEREWKWKRTNKNEI